GVYAAVQRQSRDGRPARGWYRKEEGLSTTAALRGYLLGPARATGEARLKGKLSRGYLADIVVLSEDITRLRGRRLLAPRVDMVFVGGRLRYRRRGA
ncbi:MAG: amidohydrolase family protein, partial [Proteobacteria bacterium]|nr:amidohydrolase family protein [Pseudomonadota bacterium]